MATEIEIDFDVIIIGAGISGIDMAYRLKQDHRSFLVLERMDTLGGTWRLFTYPGIRSDSDMATFGFSWKPWSTPTVVSPKEAIIEYLTEAVTENGLDDHIVFQTEVKSADWKTAAGRWVVTTEQGEVFSAQFLYAATGYYHHSAGYTPDFPGIEEFKGVVLHPQAWPKAAPGSLHAGQKVVVIGSGATAVTLVPALAEQAAHVTMLQRTPTYYASRPMQDGLSALLLGWLPSLLAAPLVRWLWITKHVITFQLCMWLPGLAKAGGGPGHATGGIRSALHAAVLTVGATRLPHPGR